MEKTTRERQQIQALALSIKEAERFIQKAKAAQSRLADIELSSYKPYQVSEYAGAKRAALDLKGELTNITNKKYW